MVKAVVALGSNLAPRRRFLAKAKERISGLKGCTLLEKSRVYETVPLGGPPQGMFLNAAVWVDVTLPAEELLNALLNIENALGRKRLERNAPRTIDLDLIFYGDLISKDPGIEIPHPRFRERGFVLLPLHDIIPGFVDPETGKTVRLLLEEWRRADGGGCAPLGSFNKVTGCDADD